MQKLLAIGKIARFISPKTRGGGQNKPPSCLLGLTPDAWDGRMGGGGGEESARGPYPKRLNIMKIGEPAENHKPINLILFN